ncbi:MAG: polyprenyl synthetase family protein [Peptoniphilaceae bacterium]
MRDYSELISELDNYIYKNFTAADEYQKKVYESMTYSLSSGGKRIRPLLCLITYIAMSDSKDYSKALPFAAAIELIHTYSLIHDDLPAMDDDDIRRGKPTNHKVYSEAIAILAGDGLLNMSMELLTRELEAYEDLDDLKRAIKAMKYIFYASGVHGMIGGQVIDLDFEDDMSLEICESMYKLKTAALLRAAIVSGAILAGATDSEVAALEEFSNCIGISYQIKDDILDKDLDKKKEKNTILKFNSVEDLNLRIASLTERAKKELKTIDHDTSELEYYANKLMNRSK